MNIEISKMVCKESIFLDWSKSYDPEYLQQILKNEYYFVTSTPGLVHLVNSYRIPEERIYLIVHDDDDFKFGEISFQQIGMSIEDVLNKLHGCAVVSSQLIPSVMSKGYLRIPDLVQCGIVHSDWKFRLRENIHSIGICGATNKPSNIRGIDIKRGRLIECVAANLGIELKRTGCSLEDVIDWYDSIDLNMIAGVFEGNPLSPYEAAACGIPTIGVEIGSWSNIAKNGGGKIVPVADSKYIRNSIDLIKYYIENPSAYSEMSIKAREESFKYDWSKTINSWYDFFDSPSRDFLL